MSFDIFAIAVQQQEVYREGMRAFEEEIGIEECPYDSQSTFGILWTTGWESMAGLAEIEAERQMEDQRLDDPRHGQAAGINRNRGRG